MISSDLKEVVTSAVDRVIPAVPGEFYSYQCSFTDELPLGCLMKCKASKKWMMQADPRYFPHEVDLTFLFGRGATMCSPDSDLSRGFMRQSLGFEPTSLNRTLIGPANVSLAEFNECYDEKEASKLIDACRASAPSESFVKLAEGMIIALQTSTSKYGLMLVRSVTDTEVDVTACHILV